MRLRGIWWGIRYKLSQWLYPHKCPTPATVWALFQGGPISGRQTKVVGAEPLIVVPVLKTVPIKYYQESDTLIINGPPIENHQYKLKHILYEHVD